MGSKRIIEVRILGDAEDKKRKKTEPKNDIDSDIKVDSLLDNAVFQLAVRDVANFLKEAAVYGINKHLDLTDNYIGERYLNAGLSVLNRSMSMGYQVAAGAMIGGVPGAIVGAIAAVADLSFDIFKNFDQEIIHIKQMDAQLSYQRQRAGYSLTSGSIGENK